MIVAPSHGIWLLLRLWLHTSVVVDDLEKNVKNVDLSWVVGVARGLGLLTDSYVPKKFFMSILDFAHHIQRSSFLD